jgi:transcription antitermination protein NusB
MGQPHEQPGAPDTGASSRRQPRGRRRVDTRDPRRSRERALKILFQADIRGEAADALLARIVDDPRAWVLLDELDPEAAAEELPGDGAELDDAGAARRRKQLELDGFTRSLVQGVADHQEDLDELIQRFARRWTVARMPAIDRNLLRLGSYELAHEVTSPAVVINEVIELAKRLSTEDSGRYVNGVLEAVRKHLADRPREAPVPDAELEPVVPDTTDAPPFEPPVVEPPTDEPLGAEPVVAGPAVAEPVVVESAPADPVVEAEPVEAEPVEAEPVEAEPVEAAPVEAALVELDPVELEPAQEDVLPPPDDEGDAVDLVAEVTPDEPDEELILVDDADGSDDTDPPGDDEADVPVPGAGQQQLF